MRRSKMKVVRALAPAVLMFALLLSWTGTDAFALDTSDDYLHAANSTLYDQAGNPVRLTGIAWFGFETQNQVYHGLWSVNMEAVLDTVADLGFNVLRIPLCVQLVNQWRNGDGGAPGSVNYAANPGLAGMTSLQILDASIAYCKQIGLKVMLDMHRVVNTQMLDAWYTDDYPPGDFEACWQWLAGHYADDDTVIAMDLFNEPHGAPGDPDMVKWDDSTDPNNWKYEAEKVANLVLDINPELLVVVEGIEATPKDGYTYAETNSANYDFNWWGGNLRRVRTHPIDLGGRQSQLVYSPHDYGPSVYAQPWFYSGFTKASLAEDCWLPNWLYIAIQGLAPVLVGEWGGRMDGGDNQQWMGFLAETIAQYDLNHTFWCVNPNSGDTGGILLDDWQSVDAAKYDLIEPTLWKDAEGRCIGLDHQVDLGTDGTHVGEATVPDDDDGGGAVPVTGITVSPAALSLDGATTAQLTATVAPADASDKSVTWSSSNTGIATVSAAGLVTAVANGSALITATTQDGAFSATCTVSVTAIDDNTTTPCDSPTEASLPHVIDGAGEYCRVTSGDISFINSWNMDLVEINGVDFTNTWSNRMPARIGGNYYIHYVGQYPWSHLEVNGKGGGGQIVPVTGVTVAPASTSVQVGATTTLTATLAPSNATDKGVTWTSSDAGVATVDAAGVVTGVSLGSVSMTVVTTDGGFTAVSEVTVDDEADGDDDDDDVLPDACAGQCNAATPVYPTLLGDGGLGNVTMYATSASDGGACNYGTTDVMHYAAINVNVLPDDAQGQWQGGRICGQCAEVTALTSQGPQTVVVRIMDKCPDAYCGIDLGGAAPAQIMLDGSGRYTGKWRFVSCDGHPEVSDGPPTLDVLQGSNAWWSRVHVRNAPTATDTIEWQAVDGTASGFLPFAADPENAFEVPVDAVLQSGRSAVRITVHYVDGATAAVILTPDQLATASASYALGSGDAMGLRALRDEALQ